MREFAKIEAALRRLDLVPTQVLIEASIIEVTLVDDLQYGVEWHLRNSLGGGRTGNAILNLNDSGAIGPRTPGFSYSVANSAGTLRAVINALAERSLVNVISTPSVMVLDNYTAAIHVGDQQPIEAGTVVSEGGHLTTPIEYKDTGVKLEVTPSVNASSLVTMDILQSVTDVGPVDTATKQRSFLERNVSSRVAVPSGETVVLGGLIRDNRSSGKLGIPFLHTIPVIGNLFGRTSVNGTRTELLVFITPRVVRGEQDLRDISGEMRARMKGLQHFDDLPISGLPTPTVPAPIPSPGAPVETQPDTTDTN
jgi:general secretion pathway protein D